MYDINFFSIYKKRRAKNNGFRIFVLVFLALFVLVNALLIGGGLLLFNKMEQSINEKTEYINSSDTKAKIDAAAKTKSEAELTAKYLTLLQAASDKYNQLDIVDSALLNDLRKLTPMTTAFTASSLIGNSLDLQCQSSNNTDPLDMYHALLGSPLFTNVILGQLNTDAANGVTSFTISLQIVGGEQP